MFSKFFASNSFTGIAGFLLLGGVALVVFIFLGRSYYYSRASQSWPFTLESEVLSSHVIRSTSQAQRGAPDYVPKIRYKYQVADQWYAGDQLSFWFANRSSKNADKIVARYPEGESVRVFYNPGRPDMSVLEPGHFFGGTMGLIIVFVFLGAAFLMKYLDAREVKKQNLGK